MPKIAYEEIRLQSTSRQIIDDANTILEEYAAQGYVLTLRQLYYQFVARGLIANNHKEYKRLGDIVDKGRLAGLIDWEHIVDRTRYLQKIGTVTKPLDAVNATVEGYLEDKWRDQLWHIEVWIEKDSLSDVFERVCTAEQVGLFSCRGYSSQSEMWNASLRLNHYAAKGKEVRVLHFSDHDPSGVHMTEDIRKRLERFRCDAQVKRIALTPGQIKKYKLPPNPAKLTDPRAEEYIEKHGNISWEMDALSPTIFNEMARKEIHAVRNQATWDAAIEHEEKNRAILKGVADSWNSVTDHVKHYKKRSKMREKMMEHISQLAPGQRRSAFVKRVVDYLDGYED